MSENSDHLQLGPIGQVSLLTRSASAAEAWYGKVLGLPHIFTFGDLVFFDCGGTRLYIREARTTNGGPARPCTSWSRTSRSHTGRSRTVRSTSRARRT